MSAHTPGQALAVAGSAFPPLELDGPRQPDSPPCGRVARSAILWLGAGIGFVALWSTLIPLHSAVVASAVVTVEGSRKPVQSQTGGTVKQLFVKEGDAVHAGQVLLEFDRVQAAAQHDVHDKHYVKALIQRARLQAEASGAAAVTWPAEVTARHEEAAVAALTAIEEMLFEARRREYRGRRELTQRRIAELQEQLSSYAGSVKSVAEQIEFIREEQAGVAILLAKGLERKPRMLALQRAEAGLVGERGRLLADERRTRESLAAAELEFANLEYDRRNKVVDELTTVESQLNEIQERRRGARQLLDNTTLAAGEDGYVVDLKFFGPGAVVAPGEPILDIVPRRDARILIAQVKPSDIDSIHVGLPAEARLLAYDMQHVEPIAGEVVTVSADRLIDPGTQQPYFEARIRVSEESLAQQPGIELYPGMPADVVIKTGARSTLEYLTKPVTRYLFTSFREE